MKVSEVSVDFLVDYLRLDEPTDIEKGELITIKKSAVEYIKSYTGLDENQIDSHEDITQALLLLVADMFDNRNLYIEGKANNINKAVECILSMHSTNLL